MLRSGLVGGLRRAVEAEREPVEVDAGPAPREDTSWKIPTDAGFQLIGEWTQDSESRYLCRELPVAGMRKPVLHYCRPAFAAYSLGQPQFVPTAICAHPMA